MNIEQSKLIPATKSGRAFNGAHSDAGTIVHFVKPLDEHTSGYWGNKALCGAIPGSRSNGWYESNKEVNCAFCIKKNAR